MPDQIDVLTAVLVELRKIRTALEASDERVVRRKRAARMLGMSVSQFAKLRPIPAVVIPGEVGEKYLVSHIDAMLEQLTQS